MTGQISFLDERIKKKGDNIFETSVILSFRDGKDNKTVVGKSAEVNVGRNMETIEFINDDWYSCERRKMKEEAKKAALSVFFKDVYGYTDRSDIAVDEFDRPLIDKTVCDDKSCLDCPTIDLTTET